MAEKYKNKYRNGTISAKWWDFGWNGAYFVTICTKNRYPHLGYITNREMHLSTIGKVAESCWKQIPEHFPFVKLGEFVLMPDHIHGVIIIQRPDNEPEIREIRKTRDHNQFGPQSENLASIIRGFKIGVTKECSSIWQSRYWVHIIETKEAFRRISVYIRKNPAKWKK